MQMTSTRPYVYRRHLNWSTGPSLA